MHLWDMTRSYVTHNIERGRDISICAPLIYLVVQTSLRCIDAPMGHDSFIWDVWRDLFIWDAPNLWGAWLIYVWLTRLRCSSYGMRRLYGERDSFMCDSLLYFVIQTSLWCTGAPMGHDMCCSVVQCGAVWCSVLQCVAVHCIVVQCVAVFCNVLYRVTVCCSEMPCVALLECRSSMES